MDKTVRELNGLSLDAYLKNNERHFSEFIYQNIGCNLLGKWGRKCSRERRIPCPEREKERRKLLTLS